MVKTETQHPSLAVQGCSFGLALGIMYLVVQALYNIYFHPLANFPGPLLARSSLLWRIWHSMGGRFHRAIDKQHKRYGSVVRISPNELSFGSIGSWKDIYGHPTAGKPILLKSEFYEVYGSGYDCLCIGSERNAKEHARMKRYLSAAFSTRALSEQEDIIKNCVDHFVEKVGIEGSKCQGVNMTKWFEMVSFDILGEMAFGESFHCIETGKPHFWQELILEHLFFITLIDNLRRYPVLLAIGRRILPKWTTSVRDKHSGHSRRKVSERLASKETRKDFLSCLIDEVRNGNVSKEELTAHSSTLIIAGGETVSTFLAACTFYLLKNADAYRKLRREIRERYSSESQICASSAQKLPYLQAVISEGLRIYPPGSQGFPRVSQGTTVDGHWVPAGAEVYTSAWTVTHDPTYFHDPMLFVPERWLNGECQDIKEASQPFSLGPRGCLGRNFAMVEMSLILAKLHYMYDLEIIDNDLDWEGESHIHVMWWKPDLMIRFRKAKEDIE